MLTDLLSCSSFSPAEQQLILLTASARNGCLYCVAAHSPAAAGWLDKEVIEAVRMVPRRRTPGSRHWAHFTEHMIERRGKADDAEIAAFVDAGFTEQQVVELLVGLAMKTLSNSFSRLAGTPLDDFLSRMAWDGNDRV